MRVGLVLTVVAVLVFVWVTLDRVRPLQAAQVRASGGRWWAAALLGAGTQVAAVAVVFVLSAVLATGGERLGGPVLGAVLGSLPLLPYATVAFAAVPSRVSAYRDVREDLERAGATEGVQRGLAWAGGPFAVAGVGIAAFVLVQLWT
ncbi:hypothetical protein GCM10028777_34460 [Angustibacter speluncae]